MVTVSMLTIPDFSKEFVVEIDASGIGLRTVLIQERKPIYYLSKALSLKNQDKLVYKKELMAIVMTLQKWRYYLLGRHFKLQND